MLRNWINAIAIKTYAKWSAVLFTMKFNCAATPELNGPSNYSNKFENSFLTPPLLVWSRRTDNHEKWFASHNVYPVLFQLIIRTGWTRHANDECDQRAKPKLVQKSSKTVPFFPATVERTQWSTWTLVELGARATCSESVPNRCTNIYHHMTALSKWAVYATAPTESHAVWKTAISTRM